MTRRGLLQSLLATSIWTAWKGRGFAAQPSSTKEAEDLQKNWKALLAEGVKVRCRPSRLNCPKTNGASV